MSINDNQSPKRYVHFVITLFNLRNFLDGSRDERIWINWTTERIGIFKRFCLPSVVKQTEQSFKWLLYFDTQTPVELVETFRREILYDNIEIIFKNGYEDFYASYLEDLKARTPPHIKWIVQTRFDNDDILHKAAIRIIQSHIEEKHQFIISLASGYTYQLNTGYLSHYYYPMSPFITLIENTDMDMKGIYYCNHWQWPDLKLWIYREFLNLLKLRKEKVHFVLRPRLWIQLIHDSNMHNSSDRGLPVFRKKDLTDFLPILPTAASPLRRLKNHVHYVWWKRYFKSAVVAILRRMFFKKD